MQELAPGAEVPDRPEQAPGPPPPACGVAIKATKRELRELRLMVDNYREGYQKALNDMLQRLDWLMENSEDMDWHRGVLAARFELSSLNWEQLKKERSERRASGGATT